MSRIRADKIVNRAGTGAPELPYGISTPVGLNVSGIVTATEFKGKSHVGIQSGGNFIGAGITTINFVGTGNSIRVNSSDATVVDVSITGGSGGGSAVGTGMSATGINTGGFFSNPNSVDAAISLTNPDHNYGMFGPVALNATVTVGAGNTFTVV
jgi:hypothetical protein